MRTRVYCTFTFEALHQWAEACGAVAYLKFPHRHLFHVRCEIAVETHNREIEFLTLRAKAVGVVAAKLSNSTTMKWSCEHWAAYLLKTLGLSRCEVSEDGENGAIIESD